MIESVLGIGCLAALVCLCYSIGVLLIRLLRVSFPSVAEQFVFAVALGMGCVSYFVFACGLLHAFRQPLFYTLIGLGAAASPLLIRDISRSVSGRRVSATEPHEARLIRFAFSVVGIIAVCAMIAALAPPTEWDALSYHLAGPKTFLRAGRIFYIPYAHQTNFPFTLQMLYTLMLGVGSVGGAKLCHWLCAALLTISVFTFSRRHIGPEARGTRIGALAAVIVASTPMVVWESTVAYTDLATALFTWLSLYALINVFQNSGTPASREDGAGIPSQRSWLVISAVLMGFALGTKFTVIAFWGFLLIGIAGQSFLMTRRVSPAAVRRALLWAVLSLCVGAPWYIKTYLYTGNPTYPFLYGLFGGRYWSADNAAQYAKSQSELGIGKSAINLLLAPWAATMLPESAKFTEYYTFNLSPVFLGLLPVASLVGKRISRPSVLIGLFGLGVTAFWFFSVQQTRYLLPAVPAFAIVCADVVFCLFETDFAPAAYLAGTLCGLSALWGAYLAASLAFFGVHDFSGARLERPAWPVVSGQISRETYVDHGLPGIGAAEFWINQNTPVDAKVAMLDVPQGFYLDREYAWAQPNHAAGLFPWDKYAGMDEWLADFKRRGYTTLLIGARDPSAPDDGQRWRSLLDEAVRGSKVVPAFAAPAMRGTQGPVYVQVYRIP